MTVEQTLYVCEDCMGCAEEDRGECEGQGFYEEPRGDICCPCCGDLIAEEEPK